MNKSLRLFIAPLMLLAGVALSACSGGMPTDLLSYDGVGELDVEINFTGIVQAVSDEVWTIADQIVGVTAETSIDGEIVVGDTVEVEALIVEDGSLVAVEIKLIEDEASDLDDEDMGDELDDTEYEFTGIVESIGDDAWVISGQTVAIKAETEIDADIAIGDVVEVEAIMDEDGSLTAIEIELEGDGDLDNEDDSDDDRDDDEIGESDNDDDEDND